MQGLQTDVYDDCHFSLLELVSIKDIIEITWFATWYAKLSMVIYVL